MIKLPDPRYIPRENLKDICSDHLIVRAYKRNIYKPYQHIRGSQHSHKAYTWDCPGCGQEFEGLPKPMPKKGASERPIHTCPSCDLQIDCSQVYMNHYHTEPNRLTMAELCLRVWREQGPQGDA